MNFIETIYYRNTSYTPEVLTHLWVHWNQMQMVTKIKEYILSI